MMSLNGIGPYYRGEKKLTLADIRRDNAVMALLSPVCVFVFVIVALTFVGGQP
jgi:hypothetical protein